MKIPGSFLPRWSRVPLLLVLAAVMIADSDVSMPSAAQQHLLQTTQYIAGQIRLLQTILPTLDAIQLEHLKGTARSEMQLQVRSDGEAEATSPATTGFAASLARRLEEKLGEPIKAVRRSETKHHGLGGFRCGREALVAGVAGLRSAGNRTLELVSRLAIALVALLLIAGLFVRSIVRPLKRSWRGRYGHR